MSTVLQLLLSLLAVADVSHSGLFDNLEKALSLKSTVLISNRKTLRGYETFETHKNYE